MTTDELLTVTLETALMLAEDSHAANMEYRAGYADALANLLLLAKQRAAEREKAMSDDLAQAAH